jgi:hypothetical protein
VTNRPIKPLVLPDIVPGGETLGKPTFTSVDPNTLLVDESYQRNLSEKSVRLIRRIVAGWSWQAFKPPVVVEQPDGLHVIDGQHTAIAAATHPGIVEIPVMLIRAESQQERAGAFVRHNRDRIAISQTQLHFALVAAGDENALTIQQVCERAGARVLKLPPNYGRFKVGDTMAIVALRSLVSRRNAKGAREVVQVCVDGMMAPVTANALKAVEMLLFDRDYAGQLDPRDLSTTIREMGPDLEKKAGLFAAEHDVPLWRALVVTLFKNTRKVRRGHRAAA